MPKEFGSEEEKQKYERKTAYRQGWYKRNKDKCNEYALTSYYRRLKSAGGPAAMEKVRKGYREANKKLVMRKEMLRGARKRSGKKGVPCTITLEDITIPELCPLLGIPLFMGNGKQGPNSPTLDRMINSLGYVPGNIWVVSNKANICKSNLSPDEIILVGVRLKAMIGKNSTGELQ